MLKYFKNENRITVNSLLKFYEKFDWGHYPQFTSNKNKAYKMIQQCQESDQYRNWKAQCNQLKIQIKELAQDIDEIKYNQIEIKIKNSPQEYNRVLKDLQIKYQEAKNKLSNKQYRPPKSKQQLLKKIYESMQQGQKDANQQMRERQKYNDSKCRCSGYNCEC